MEDALPRERELNVVSSFEAVAQFEIVDTVDKKWL